MLQLLSNCPAETAHLRKELLIAAKHILTTELRNRMSALSWGCLRGAAVILGGHCGHPMWCWSSWLLAPTCPFFPAVSGFFFLCLSTSPSGCLSSPASRALLSPSQQSPKSLIISSAWLSPEYFIVLLHLLIAYLLKLQIAIC